MGLESFDLPCGSAGDVAELEYISALHQSGQEVRLDGSVKACDIRLYLASRYGITVTDEQVKEVILPGLGADVDDDVLDLVEVVACLLIPTFLKVKNQQQGNPLPQFVIEANPELIQKVLETIQNDVVGSDDPPELTVDLVREILQAYGEHELADNHKLLNEMVEICSVGNPGPGQKFDKYAFGAGLTSDIELLDLANEGSLSTNLADVISNKDVDTNTNDETALRLDEVLDDSSVLFQFTAGTRQKKTYSQIDVTAGNFRSKSLIILLWATFAVSYFSFSFKLLNDRLDRICWPEESFEYSTSSPWSENAIPIVCESVISILLWLFYFIGLAVLGLIYVTVGSTGNSVFCKDWKKPLIGAWALFLPVAVLYFVRRDDAGSFLSQVSLALALITSIHHLCHAAYLGWPLFRNLAERRHWLLASSLYAEMRLKASAANKLNTLVENALDIFRKANDGNFATGTQYSMALQSYAKHGQASKPVGGLVWAWKRLFGVEEPNLRDGIWISTRLLASNVSQYIVALWMLIYGSYKVFSINEDFSRDVATKRVQDFAFDLLESSNADSILVSEAVGNVTSLVRDLYKMQESTGVNFGCDGATGNAEQVLAQYCKNSTNEPPFDLVCEQNTDLNLYLCPFLNEDLTVSEQLALLTGSSANGDPLMQSLSSLVQHATQNAIQSIYPSREYMLTIPVAVATLFAFLTAGYLAVSYIPSVMYTTLKLRTGIIPSLRDPRFFKFREAPDLVAILTGSIFWGTVGSGLVVGGTIGLLVFFFLWQASVYYAQRLLAVVVGFVGVTIIRVLYLRSRRILYFRSFYREFPGPANLLLLALEWAYFALSVGFIIVRLIKLLLCAAFNVGRIDTPFLAPGVGRIGNIELDHYHLVHLQDILTHEAHRHPYIELLGVIYMMKLRHGKRFGTRAGSCWRLIFVHALLPWLQHYRVLARPELAGRINQTEGSLVRPGYSLPLSAGINH